MQIRTKNGTYTKTFLRYMRNAYNLYIKSNCDSIYKAYENPSQIKIDSWYSIKNRADTTPYIIGHNCMKYTAAYINQNLGEEIFIVETANNTYSIELRYL